jgi:hypothetical protein
LVKDRLSSIQDSAHRLTDARCPLCAGADPVRWFRDRRRDYLRCNACALVYVPRAQHLDADEERRRYDQHNNDPADPAYRRFLSALCQPMIERLSAGAAGLDYGSGPGPTLSLMFEEAGHPMRIYDPFYADDRAALRQRYDFVTCSEVAEHFAEPGREWKRLIGLLKPGGRLGVMTSLLTPDIDFGRWYYKDDPTHVCFYAPETIAWLAARHRLQVEFLTPAVVLLLRGE